MDQFLPHTQKRGSLLNTGFSYIERLAISDRLLFKLGLVGLCAFVFSFLIALSSGSQIEIASHGGSLTEGVVGTPRFVNPALAVTRADKDLSALIYEGIMHLGPDGKLVPNVAESVTVSDDGLTYNVILRKDVHFHDGSELTAADVAFTIGRIQEPSLASPLRSNFDGVTVEQINEYELNFVLPEAYAPFIENLTFGILPEHLWKEATNEEFPFSQLNSEPIGSGPYQIKKIVRNASGIPEAYILSAFEEYHGGAPKIDSFTLHFYPNEDTLVKAFTRGEVEAVAGIDQSRLFDLGVNTNTHTVLTMPLPRTFALFFNQNKSTALRDEAARKALDVSIDRSKLVDTVLGGYGRPLTSPIPPGFGIDIPDGASSTGENPLDEARAILKAAGWKLNSETGIWEKTIDGAVTPLSITIATVNNPLFEATAEFLRSSWEPLGVTVSIKQFEQSDLTQSIIRPRDYEALLFGTHVGRPLDFYPFWHSSQRNDPGLNVALYANITIDSILSQSRASADHDKQTEALQKFAEEINKETPALFLYTPELIYVFPNKVLSASFVGIAEPQERFASIRDWYINTESVWPFFRK